MDLQENQIVIIQIFKMLFKSGQGGQAEYGMFIVLLLMDGSATIFEDKF